MRSTGLPRRWSRETSSLQKETGFARPLPGKDSLAAWLAMREAGITVVPYHLCLAPGMRFVDDLLHFYEDFFGIEIINLPHPSF